MVVIDDVERLIERAPARNTSVAVMCHGNAAPASVERRLGECPSSGFGRRHAPRYTPVGPRFSNTVLQTLLVLLKKAPEDPDKRLLVLATTAIATHLEDLQLVDAFNVSLRVPQLEQPDEIALALEKLVPDAARRGAASPSPGRGFLPGEAPRRRFGSRATPPDARAPRREQLAAAVSKPLGIKQLLMVLEMARDGEGEARRPGKPVLRTFGRTSAIRAQSCIRNRMTSGEAPRPPDIQKSRTFSDTGEVDVNDFAACLAQFID